MSTISIEIPVELPAEQVEAELANAGGLTPFLSEPLRSEANRTESECRVSVSESRPGTCAVLVELRTDRTDGDVVRTELQRAVASLSQRVLADDNTEDTGRAWH